MNTINEKELILKRLGELCDVKSIKVEFNVNEDELVNLFKSALLKASDQVINRLQREGLIGKINLQEEEYISEEDEFESIYILEKEYIDPDELLQETLLQEERSKEPIYFGSIPDKEEMAYWNAILKKEGF